MADFDTEQLKTLFENLGDRLDKTKGDQLSRDELYRIRNLLSKMATQAGKTTAEPLDTDKFVKKFFSEWKKNQPKGGSSGKGTVLNQEAPKSRKSFIQEERARKAGSTEGFTFLDRELRKSGYEANSFGKSLNSAGKEAGGFGDKLSKGGSGLVATIAGIGAGVGKALLNRVDYYRDVLASGEGSIDSIQDMARSANAAGVTVEQFAKAMKEEGTKGVRLMGGIRWLELNKGVRDMTRATGAMGMTAEQMQETSGVYAEVIAAQGKSRELSNDQMVKGMYQLVRSSEATANILGLTRKEALDMAKEQASNANANAVMRARGYSDDQIQAIQTLAGQMKDTYGQGGETMVYDKMIYGQAQNKSAVDLQIVGDEVGQAVSASLNDIGRNRTIDQRDMTYNNASRIKGASNQITKDNSRMEQYGMLGALGDSPLADALTGFNKGSQAWMNAKLDKTANAGTEQANGSEERKATIGALGVDGLIQDAKVGVDSLVTALTNPAITQFGGLLKDTINPALSEFAKKLSSMALGAADHTGIMGTIGAGTMIAGGAAGLFGGLGVMKAGKGLLGGAGRLLGLGGRVAGAAGAVGGAGGAAGAAGAAGGGLLIPAAAIVGGALGVGAGGSMVSNRSGESFTGTGKNEQGFWGSRLTGYGTAIASGAGGGAAVGSLGLGIGAIPGAIIGGLGGLAYAGYNDLTSSPKASPAARTPQPPPRQAANATGQKGRNVLSPEQVNTKMMEACERSANHLKMIKENSDKQLDLTRDEVAAIRGMSDRLGRLLEDVSRNTKMIADHSF
jgi:hypothetical protein